MPDYRITIHMKTGEPKRGVRWHPSYDADWVTGLVEKKARKILGTSQIKWVEVEIDGHTTGERMERKYLED